MAPIELRKEAWERLTTELDKTKLEAVTTEIQLSDALNFSNEIFEQKNSKNALDLAVEIAKGKSGSSGVIVLGSIALAGEILQHSKSI